MNSSDQNNNGGIFNEDQGYFRNNNTKHIANRPTLNLAALSNCSSNDKTPDVIISLNTIFLNWSDFAILFFKPPSGAFNINLANVNVKAVSFTSQTYETTYDKNVSYNLADQVKKAWSKKNSKPESVIPPQINIELNRESFLTKSLGSICGNFVGLSYDEVLTTLLGNNVIAVGTTQDSACVTFLITYQYYFKPLDITLLTVFSYGTNIPCYKNVEPFCCDCNPYSNDNKVYDRSYFDFNDNMSVFSDFESKNNDEYSVTSSSKSINTNTMSEISKIIKNTNLSVASSQW